MSTGQYNIDGDVVMEDGPSEGDFLIDVLLVGRRDPFVPSPARERFNHCIRELTKLAWMTATTKALFHQRLDSLLVDEMEPEQQQAYDTMAAILRGMHALDHFNDEQLRANVLFSNGIGVSEPLLEVIVELKNWQHPDDQPHVEELAESELAIRHCTSVDYAKLLEFLSVVEAQFNEHILPRYMRILHSAQNNEVGFDRQKERVVSGNVRIL